MNGSVNNCGLTMTLHAAKKAFLVAGVAVLASSSLDAALGETLPERYRWQNVRVGGGGFSPGIVFSRASKDLAYLRTDIGGLYRWDSSAASWIPLQDHFSESNYFGVESVAPDPIEPDVVYAAVGMYSHGPAAILRSADRGANWEIYPVPFRMGGNEAGRGLGERLSIDPNDSSILLFGSRHDGLQRSVDRGRHWAKVTAFPRAGLGPPARGSTHPGISFVVFDPASGGKGTRSRIIFVGVADEQGRGVYRSIDAGASWSLVPNQPHGFVPAQARIDARGVLYVTYASGPGPNGITDGAVYRLDTRSDEWTDITPHKSQPRPPGGYMGLSIDGQRPGTVVVATVNRWLPGDTIWRTTDEGRTWRSLSERSHRSVDELPFLKWGGTQPEFGHWMSGVAIDPFDSSRMAYTTGATVYVTRELSDDGNISWRPWVEGVEETAVLTLVSPAAGASLLSGFGDISGFTHDDLARSPRTMWVDPTFNNTVFLEYAERAPHIVVRAGTPRMPRGSDPKNAVAFAWSEDQGRNWQPLHPPGALDVNGTTPITVSSDGSTFVVSTATPVLTRDRGKTWSTVRGLPGDVRIIADRGDPARFYGIDFARAVVYASTDAGATFRAHVTRGLPPQIHDDRPMRVDLPWPLVATPRMAGELWLVLRAGLFRSRDGGRSFSRVPSHVSVTALSFGKSPPQSDHPTLYAIGTRDDLRAIWRSDDEGLTWLRLNDERHEYGRRYRVIAGDARVFGRVYVGTDGRGIVYGEIAR
jgi:xyloglucan-specific exo-beta-1,4-glucanase